MHPLSAFLVAFLSTQTPSPPSSAASSIEPCDSVVVAQVRSTLDALRQAQSRHTGTGDGLVALYEGTIAVEGHLMRPGTVREVPVALELTTDAAGRVLALRETSGQPGRTVIETTIFREDKAASQAGEDKPFVELSQPAADGARAGAWAWLPASVLEAALASPASCRAGARIEHLGRAWSPVSFVDAAGRARSILLDAEGRVGRVERLASHQRLGDVCEWTQFSNWQAHNDASVPGSIDRFIVQDSATLRYTLSLRSVHGVPPGTDAALLPEAHHADIPTWTDAPPSGMEWVDLGEHLWSIEIKASDSRVLLAENEHDLTLLGAPDGDAVCSALLREIAQRFPEKPVARATFGHHHPASCGGLRALAAGGATILAPRPLEPFVRELLARPTSLGRPAIAAPADPTLEIFDADTTIPHGSSSIHLINIAEKSAHAFQYVVFYFPKQGIVFEDDLGYFPVSGATRAGPRLLGLADAFAARGITPRKLIQLWPVRGVLREVEWKVVQDLVHAQRASDAAAPASPAP